MQKLRYWDHSIHYHFLVYILHRKLLKLKNTALLLFFLGDLVSELILFKVD